MKTVLLSILIALPIIAQAQYTKELPPNILLITTTGMRADRLGYMGDTSAITPTIDKLAKEGVAFTQAYSTTPSATPAIMTLLTGRTPQETGILNNTKPIPPEHVNDMPHLLYDKNFITAAIGYQGLNGFLHSYRYEAKYDGSSDSRDIYQAWREEQYPQGSTKAKGLGWHTWQAQPWQLPEEAHPTAWTTREAIDWLSRLRTTKSFFLKVSYHRPHSPYDPPKRLLERIKQQSLHAPAIGDWTQAVAKPNSDPQAAYGKMDPVQLQAARQAYQASITFVDEQIGLLLDALRQSDHARNTVVIFCSLHGDMQGDHHLWRQGYPYQPAVHIPLIIYYPKSFQIVSGQKISAMVTLQDVAATCLKLAQINHTPEPIQGENLTTLARQPDMTWRQWVDLHHSQSIHPWTQWHGATDGKIKYVAFFGEKREQLFDLSKDPQELHNLASDPAYAQMLSTWRNRCKSRE